LYFPVDEIQVCYPFLWHGLYVIPTLIIPWLPDQRSYRVHSVEWSGEKVYKLIDLVQYIS